MVEYFIRRQRKVSFSSHKNHTYLAKAQSKDRIKKGIEWSWRAKSFAQKFSKEDVESVFKRITQVDTYYYDIREC